MNPDEQAFKALLEKNPKLCACGIASPELCRSLLLDFEKERQRLRSAYDDFLRCCDWLLESTPMRRVSCVAPTGSSLASYLEKTQGTPVCLGSMVAAVLYLRIPHHHPEGSADVRVGISVRSPNLNGLS